MNAESLRVSGIVVGAALIAGALLIGAQGGRTLPAQASAPAFEIAQSAPASELAFLVRFRGSGPIARAQARAAQGQTALAQRQVEAQLRRQRAFSGLCFDRFTTGGTEIVLRTCEPVAPQERALFESRWLQNLRAMRAVAYADVNAPAQAERAPG